ncbi:MULTISPECIES: MmpS family transport accessory protein [unclassified Clavibacter]|uniref:MmpS family transport accessory protein n=1 Tax=unclassified Clavibacter TaxID=2626594 RepID=UPI0022EAE04A|nr:MmpS family transport accessory protein [Clavibacter sp. CT19]MDA3806098.1 MmpS family transport accessory protein [Clavibacter sp. CT19]
MTQYAPPPASAPEAPRTNGNGLGLAALIVGIVALVGSVIPFLNYVTGFVAFVGLVLGVIALFLKNRRKGAAIAGTIISVVALILSVVLAVTYTAGFASGVSDAIETSQAEASAAAEREVTVTYELTGSATSVSATYSTFTDGNSGSEQATEQALPFSKEIVAKVGGTFDFSSFTLSGTSGTEGGDVTCRILVDGAPVAEQTATGAYASAFCSASSEDLRGE